MNNKQVLFSEYFFFSLVYFTVFYTEEKLYCACTMCKCATHSLARRLVDVGILVSFVSGFDGSSPSFFFLHKETYSYSPKMVETTMGK